jgi:hypothetical protein
MTSKAPKAGRGKNQRSDGEVGYGRPPVAHQFRPGQVGNPRGRPKKSKTVGQMIQDALVTTVTIEENGRRKKMTPLEVIIRNLVSAAAHRDMRAITMLFKLRDHYQDSSATNLDPSDLNTDDRKIIEEYLASFARDGGRDEASPGRDGDDSCPNENNPDNPKSSSPD